MVGAKPLLTNLLSLSLQNYNVYSPNTPDKASTWGYFDFLALIPDDNTLRLKTRPRLKTGELIKKWHFIPHLNGRGHQGNESPHHQNFC